MRPTRLHLLTVIALLVAGLSLPAQNGGTPQTPEREPAQPSLSERTQALVDEFIAVMPRDPRELRDPEMRRKLAPEALPVLRRVLEFTERHPTSVLAPRRHEFTVYALALGAADLRDRLLERGDPDSVLLLRSADVLTAEGTERREAAVAACADALGARAVDAVHRLEDDPDRAEGEPAPATEASRDEFASCAVQCLSVAGDLSEREARVLAERVSDEQLKGRLVAIAERSARDPRQLVGKPFSVEGKQPDGAAFSTASLRGKVVLIDFWATWCRPCVAAMPELVRLREQHGADKLAIVGVSCDRDRKALEAFLEKHPQYDWPHLFAPGTQWHPIATAHGVESIPRLFLLDRDGVLRSVDAAQHLEELVRRYVAR